MLFELRTLWQSRNHSDDNFWGKRVLCYKLNHIEFFYILKCKTVKTK